MAPDRFMCILVDALEVLHFLVAVNGGLQDVYSYNEADNSVRNVTMAAQLAAHDKVNPS